MKTPKQIGLIFTILAMFAGQVPALASEDDSHVDEVSDLSHKEKMSLLATHLDQNVFDPDYRFQRDAAVVAVGCGTISSTLFPKHATECYKNGWKAIRSGKLKFGTLINIVCSHVHNTLPFSDNLPFVSYEDCLDNLAKAYPEKTKGLIQSKIDECRGSYSVWSFDYTDKTKQCYQARVPDIEQDLENFQKGQVFTIADEQTEGEAGNSKLNRADLLYVDDIPDSDMNPDTAKLGAVRKVITQDFPPRSFWDRQKLDALQAACTSMNTDDLNPDEIQFARMKTVKRLDSLMKSTRDVDQPDKVKLTQILAGRSPFDYVMSQSNIEDVFMSPYEKHTYSWWRDDHCYSDGFYAMALGAKLPNTLFHACKGRIPGPQWDFLTNTHVTIPHLKLPRWKEVTEGKTTKWTLTGGELKKGHFHFEPFTNWKHEINLVDFIDHKTTCLKAGVRNIDMRPYQDIIKDSSTYVFEDLVNLYMGFYMNDNVYEEKLKLKNRNLIAQQKSTQGNKFGTNKGMSNSPLSEEAAILQILQQHPELIDKAANSAKGKIKVGE